MAEAARRDEIFAPAEGDAMTQLPLSPSPPRPAAHPRASGDPGSARRDAPRRDPPQLAPANIAFLAELARFDGLMTAAEQEHFRQQLALGGLHGPFRADPDNPGGILDAGGICAFVADFWGERPDGEAAALAAIVALALNVCAGTRPESGHG